MSKNDLSNYPELLNLSKDIEILESKRQQLLEHRNLCKDKLELKEIEKQLKQIDSLMKKCRSTEAKVLRTKVG